MWVHNKWNRFALHWEKIMYLSFYFEIHTEWNYRFIFSSLIPSLFQHLMPFNCALFSLTHNWNSDLGLVLNRIWTQIPDMSGCKNVLATLGNACRLATWLCDYLKCGDDKNVDHVHTGTFWICDLNPEIWSDPEVFNRVFLQLVIYCEILTESWREKRERERACVRACVRARACVCVCVCVWK